MRLLFTDKIFRHGVNLTIACLFMVLLPVQADELVEVNTALGVLVGERQHNVSIFRGVPYAVPPVGNRRWRPPQALKPWHEKRLSTSFAPACMQLLGSDTSFYYMPIDQMSEDCLYLNIWTGADFSDDDKRPVMVWIHGGALTSGVASAPIYDGAALADKGAVVVSINYRLNVFGYFAHAELNKESKQGVSGNYGILDQIEALQWVRDHISRFGGDPNNVTVFGESAGALSITHLMAAPLARNLFHKAIMQSVYMPPSLHMNTARYGKPSALDVGRQLEQAAAVNSLAELRDLPAQDLLQVAQQIAFYPVAVIDDYLFNKDIVDIFEAGEQTTVPVIVGFNSGEVYPYASFGLVPPVPDSEEAYIKAVKARFGKMSEQYLALYPATNMRTSVFSASRDGYFGWAAEGVARAGQRAGAPAYFYLFDQVTPAAKIKNLGAFHGSDVAYVFNNIQLGAKYSPNWPDFNIDTEKAMAEIMSDYWISFANGAAPQPKNRPAWRPYDSPNRFYMHFANGRAEVQQHLFPGMFEFHNQIVKGRRKKGEISWWMNEIGLFSPVVYGE